jgi:hypothetical protein
MLCCQVGLLNALSDPDIVADMTRNRSVASERWIRLNRSSDGHATPRARSATLVTATLGGYGRIQSTGRGGASRHPHRIRRCVLGLRSAHGFTRVFLARRRAIPNPDSEHPKMRLLPHLNFLINHDQRTRFL